jgi:hypothetical protein
MRPEAIAERKSSPVLHPNAKPAPLLDIPAPRGTVPHWRSKGKFALAGGAAAGGTAYLFHRRQSQKEPIMKFFNPFTGDTVELAKGFASNAFANEPKLSVPATGGNPGIVGHGRDLVVVHGKNLTLKSSSPVHVVHGNAKNRTSSPVTAIKR